MPLTEMAMKKHPAVVASHGPFELLWTGVVAPPGAKFDEWEAALKWAQEVECASPGWASRFRHPEQSHVGAVRIVPKLSSASAELLLALRHSPTSWRTPIMIAAIYARKSTEQDVSDDAKSATLHRFVHSRLQ